MTGEDARDDAGHPSGPPTAAFGWWPSPWAASTVAAGKVSRSGLQAEGTSVYWSESRPDDGGRQVVVGVVGGAAAVDVSPACVSVRTRVHEYGGGAATIAGGVLFYSDQQDQRLYRLAPGAATGPQALTPDVDPTGASMRYADGSLTASGQWFVCVEEEVSGDSTRHRLVAVATDGSERVVPLVDDTDFVAAPRSSPDGRLLAWMAWDHPSMPWDTSEIRVGQILEKAGSMTVVEARRMAGGEGIAVGQPRWCHDGSLLFVDDRTGWWLPYRVSSPAEEPDAISPGPLVDLEAEFHAPDWALGQATMAELSDGSLVCRLHRDGRDGLARLRAGPGEWSVEMIEQPCVTISGVVAADGATAAGSARVVVLGSTPTEAHSVFAISLDAGAQPRRLSAPPFVAVTGDDISVGHPFVASTPEGPVPGLFFAPASAATTGPVGSLPPLVVFCHGGPTGAAEGGFDPVVQFFTGRGLAVAAVDYRGSSGFGRAYRRRLDGEWGRADVDDCVEYAVALAHQGWVDGDRMAIRGTSAGGLTALGALIRSDRFLGAAAWYGVTDLEALAAETHAFESRYVDGLIGPWPEAAAVYRDRSPIHHAGRVSGSVLLLQGADDPVVPAAQAERFAEALADHGIPCRLVVFEGESHGFRRASTIEASLEAELDFYRWLFDGA
jgi:dipeptidyl aminopeptidase/acylaminoacyl peptidase